MSNFFRDMTRHRAAKPHTCVWCSEPILKGEIYCLQTGIWEGRAFTNHFHLECFDAVCADDDEEFMPYSNERPPSAATLEIESWDCTLIFQGRLL